MEGYSSMSTKEETTATTVRALNDALNARDRAATAALFASDGVFRPGAAGASFEGPEAITERKWAGVTAEGESAESHGCDYYLIRGGKVAVRSTLRKV